MDGSLFLRSVEVLAGVLLAWAALRDLFYTVLVPGSTRGVLKVSRRLVRAALPLNRRLRGEGQGIGADFAPIVLGASFVIWMALQVIAFALLIHAARFSFSPVLDGFGDALFVAGGSMVTIGFGLTDATGWGAVIVVLAGFFGLASLTLAVTYFLEVQGNTAQRDVGVLKITTIAGRPPSALALLERHALLDARAGLAPLLGEGREWCANVLQSHTTHPWLVYFRSAGTRTGWPAALSTVIDLALICELLLDEPGLRGPAVFAREEADRLAREICELLSLSPQPRETDLEAGERLCGRLIAAGFRMKAERDIAAFVRQREQHTACIRAVALHLNAHEAPLLPRAA